ncbi:MAG: tripartite tricarboxylate transporter substrate binding protein [Xanthobacteraceae bacterium]|jgi:tripartite-type tricarboxylate transporter receptor subunit TctC
MLNSMKAAAALGLLAAGSLAATPVHAQAQFPNQSVKFVVPFSPGGLPDTVARIVGQKLQERLGQSVVIENRPGAGGNVAAAALLGIPADGYTLMVTDGSMFTINPKLMKSLPYDPDKDFLPVVQLAQGPLFLAVHPKVPVSTMKEFIDYARANPGKINYGSSGLGTTHHLSMEAVKAALKLDMAHVPFKGTGQSVPALLGGHVEVLFSAYPSLAGAVQANQVKLLATNGPKRSAQAPDVPAVAEFIPGFDFAPVIGVFAKAGTPKAAVDKIAAEAMAVMNMPEVIAQLAKVGVEPAPAGPDGYAKGLKAESDRVAATVKAANIEPQ